MNLTACIQIFIAVPLIGFLSSLFISRKKEYTLSAIAFSTASVQLLCFIPFLFIWIYQGSQVLNLREIALFESEEYVFLIDFFFDKITAVYLLVGSILTFLVTLYSRYYLHREKGYKDFFNSILLLYLGYNWTIFSGNFETLFIGWELLGISSFLLIAFYRERYLPVRNAVKVFSIYRIGDIGILLAMWASHHLWHENISFLKLSNQVLVHEHLMNHSTIGIFIASMLLLSAISKSAQFPFSYWLPRAMEGPTPSSAIFYGSLSVHFGVFLLLRTYPFWQEQYVIRILIALIGLTTAILASQISRVQTTVKTQIAYASVAQIGLMFIELSLGWQNLVLFHFAGNAFLRTYQLLVSPSFVSYRIREQLYHYIPRSLTLEDKLPKRIEFTFYVLSVKEWNLDKIVGKLIFYPLKKMGKAFSFMNLSSSLIFSFLWLLFGFLIIFQNVSVPEIVVHSLPECSALLGMILVIRSFVERKNPFLVLVFIFLNHLFISLALAHNEHFDFSHHILYLSGTLPSALIGYICLYLLRRKEPNAFHLSDYLGHSFEYRALSNIFLLACLGLIGFPITTSFIGEDLILSHIHEDDLFLAFCVSISYVMSGISIIRLYARLFLGPHIKHNHAVPFKYS